MNFRVFIPMLALVFMMSGCGTQWQKVTPKNRHISQNGIQVDLPLDWVTIAANKSLQITSLDGPSLNSITMESITLKDIEKKLKIKLPKDLDMLNASKQFIAYWSSQTGISEFKIQSNKYVEQDGHEFFKLVWIYKSESGLTVKNVTQGSVVKGKILHVGYSAPQTYYFQKTFSVFENVLKTISFMS